ncbi:MAG: exodeoxyribonuclease VII small subunit [Fastidiosipilaceae bacterium]|jgi:exodeoxyribonuclease VII small subunit
MREQNENQGQSAQTDNLKETPLEAFQPEDSEMTFEEALQELEVVVRRMESGETTLEASMELFKKGTELTAFCTQKLNEAERKITQLVRDSDGIGHEVPFERGENDEDL